MDYIFVLTPCCNCSLDQFGKVIVPDALLLKAGPRIWKCLFLFLIRSFHFATTSFPPKTAAVPATNEAPDSFSKQPMNTKKFYITKQICQLIPRISLVFIFSTADVIIPATA